MDKVFDEEFRARLERLTIQVRKMAGGKYSGERRSHYKGHSVEFADFRSYSSGDDIRHVDWNAYARSGKLFIKLFQQERDLVLNIFLDTSQSMLWGEPAKVTLAGQVAGALAYLTLAGFDRVAVAAGADRLRDYLPPLRGRASVNRVWQFLSGLQTGGSTNLYNCCQDFGRHVRGEGLTLVISDILSPLGFKDGLKYLQYLKQDIILLQILSADEVEPGLRGDLRLVDSETGETREITVTPRLLKAYQQRREQFDQDTRAFCQRRGISFLQVSSSESLENIILRTLPAAGVLK